MIEANSVRSFGTFRPLAAGIASAAIGVGLYFLALMLEATFGSG